MSKSSCAREWVGSCGGLCQQGFMTFAHDVFCPRMGGFTNVLPMRSFSVGCFVYYGYYLWRGYH